MSKKRSRPILFKSPCDMAGLPKDTPIAVAFSGGADSMALLSLLSGHSPVYAVHVHHGIRGEEADRDATFCEEMAAKLGVPFTLLRVDAPKKAKETGDLRSG